jgi:prepilin-type processing-associated H-X9-DG protein
VLDVLSGFVAELRAAGIPVSLTESLDAAEAVRHVPLEDRDALKYALGATLVKSSSHWRAFETAFEVYFSLRDPRFSIGSEDQALAEDELRRAGFAAGDRSEESRGSGGGEALSAEELAELLFKAMLAGNDARLAAIARYAVSRFAGMEPGRPVGGTYYLYRTLRNLDLERLVERLVEAAREQAPGGVLTALEERLAREEAEERIAKLKAEIEAEIRRRLVSDRGSEALARSIRKPLPEDIDFMHATREEMLALRRAVAPLARKLAVRLARKRRHGRRGPLDFRATMRRSLSTGGVPVDPRFRYPRPAKPELVVIADISGSVAAFARFTLHLVHAMSTQFSKVRSFVFVDGIDEVTAFFDDAEDVADAIARVNTEANVVWVDGHSDYGHALATFMERWGEEVGPKSSVLVLGDARNNYHAPQSWVLKELARKARHLYWLNPEPRAYWGSGDSIIEEYGRYCEAVVECRTLRQLERFVASLA